MIGVLRPFRRIVGPGAGKAGRQMQAVQGGPGSNARREGGANEKTGAKFHAILSSRPLQRFQRDWNDRAVLKTL
jgi:hypothetical protein